MPDDAREQLKERLDRLAKKAMDRLYENRPDLRGKTPKEVAAILEEEERHNNTGWKRGRHRRI